LGFFLSAETAQKKIQRRRFLGVLCGLVVYLNGLWGQVLKYQFWFQADKDHFIIGRLVLDFAHAKRASIVD
jgi:hypothetical protein